MTKTGQKTAFLLKKYESNIQRVSGTVAGENWGLAVTPTVTNEFQIFIYFYSPRQLLKKIKTIKEKVKKKIFLISVISGLSSSVVVYLNTHFSPLQLDALGSNLVVGHKLSCTLFERQVVGGFHLSSLSHHSVKSAQAEVFSPIQKI